MNSRPAFRRSSSGGESGRGTEGGAGAARAGGGPAPASPGRAALGRAASASAAVGSPFSQAQILHLMKSEFGRARRLGHALACIVLRVDDAAAHAESAAVSERHRLRDAVARLVDERTRDYDHLGLIGDEGYLLVLPHTDLDGAVVVAERLQRDFAALELRGGAEQRVVTLSLGVAATAASDTLFFDTLLAQAEHARDRATAAGGDRIEIFRRDKFIADPEA